MVATKLCSDQKQIMKRFCEYAEHNWPTQRLNSELAETCYAAFIDPTGFWHALFKTEFKRFIEFFEAQDENNRNDRVRH
jgi:hypothetical protein